MLDSSAVRMYAFVLMYVYEYGNVYARLRRAPGGAVTRQSHVNHTRRTRACEFPTASSPHPILGVNEHVNAFAFVYECEYVHMRLYTNIRLCARACAYARACVRARACAYVRIDMHTQTHI